MSYTTYWDLREKPFEELCDTRFYFESEDHREALDRMLYIVNDWNMNMGLLTGEVGSGKTITKNVFSNSLNRHNFEVIDFDNSSFSFEDILYDIINRITFRDTRLALMETDVPSRDDKYALTCHFRRQLETLFFEEKRHLVIIFDEAQQIEDKVLDEIKNLTNIGSGAENYITVFLVGQPELREKTRRLPQVDQRIFLRFHLNNLDYNGTINYIQHRLRVAGIQRTTIFTSLAQELIFRSTGGVPRMINRICKIALQYGFAQGLDEISREDLQVILDDMQEQWR
ncbi:secretion ATPase [Chitinispirillum alkaliphilum]|nr:secretion ATPase [Chitinispirillum alkaliphilum]